MKLLKWVKMWLVIQWVLLLVLSGQAETQSWSKPGWTTWRASSGETLEHYEDIGGSVEVDGSELAWT